MIFQSFQGGGGCSAKKQSLYTKICKLASSVFLFLAIFGLYVFGFSNFELSFVFSIFWSFGIGFGLNSRMGTVFWVFD